MEIDENLDVALEIINTLIQNKEISKLCQFIRNREFNRQDS